MNLTKRGVAVSYIILFTLLLIVAVIFGKVFPGMYQENESQEIQCVAHTVKQADGTCINPDFGVNN